MALIEEYDRQQAFSAGFAMAARDWGLDQTEYAAICKVAAAMMEAPPAAPVVPITDAKQQSQANADNFAKQKAQQIAPQQVPAPQPQTKAAAAVGEQLQKALKPRAAAPKPPVGGNPPAPPPVPGPVPPPHVLPPGKSALDPAYAKQIQAWEDAQKPRVDPRKTSPGAILPGGVNRLSDALRKVLPGSW